MKLKLGSLLVLAVTLSLISMPQTSFADTPGDHPAYLHALSDLRHARAYLDRLSP
jgi:hypothetical protein